jgi:hypothetical protein
VSSPRIPSVRYWGKLPVPYVAAWSSEESIHVGRDPLLGGRPALFRGGTRGIGTPMFGKMDESRVRRVVLLRLCQICDGPIGPTGYVVDTIKGAVGGDPLLSEPLPRLPRGEAAARPRLRRAPVDRRRRAPALQGTRPRSSAGPCRVAGARSSRASGSARRSCSSRRCGSRSLAHAGGRGLIVARSACGRSSCATRRSSASRSVHPRRPPRSTGPGLYLTNYESVREGKIDVARLFTAVSLDEASVLRGFGGTKTFREFMRLFDARRTASWPRRRRARTSTSSCSPTPRSSASWTSARRRRASSSATARRPTSSPPPAQGRGVLAVGEHVGGVPPAAERPRVLDEGYELPPLTSSGTWCVDDAAARRRRERDGQGKLLRTESLGVQARAAEKRATLPARIAKVARARRGRPTST